MKRKLVCLSLAVIISLTQVVSVGATREDELRQEQAQTSEQLDATYATIDSLQEKKDILAGEIAELDQNLVDCMIQINVLKQDISNKGVEIQETKEKLKKAIEKKNEQYEAMKKRIQYLYENGGNTAWFQMLLESRDISDLLNRADYAEKMYDYDRDRLQEFKQTVRDVKDLKLQLEGEKAELEEMEQAEEDKQYSLQVQLDEKQAASDDYEAQIATAQAQAEEFAALLQQQSEEIARLEAERIAAEEEARRQAEAAAQAAAEEAARQQAEAEAQEDEGESYDTEDEYTEEDTYTEDYEEGSTDEYGNVYDDSDSSEDVSVSSGGSATGEAIANYALQFVGNPYVWGGTSLTGGADCSGFVQSVYANFGYSLSRTSESQMYEGVEVSYADAQPGDLICYGSHIAIYLGGGQIVHASNSAPYPAGGIKVSDNAAYRTILSVRRIV